MTIEWQATSHIVGIAAAGKGTQDERRLTLLLQGLDHTIVSVDRGRGRLRGLAHVTSTLWRHRREVLLVEGTGIVVGVPAIVINVLTGGRFRYLVSSGDAVGPYVRMKAGSVTGAIASLYERVLYRRSFAFLGWTPHYVGRALHLGAPRGVTIPGFPVVQVAESDRAAGRELRRSWGVPDEAFVVGIVGSINAAGPAGYGYGVELVRVADLLTDPGFRFVLVGDGPGLEALRTAAAGDERFVFTGRVAAEQVPAHMCALDGTVISQTHDLVGGLRWTTKLPEFLACGVPVVLSSTPAFLDLVDLDAPHSLIRVVGESFPGSPEHVAQVASALAALREERAADTSVGRGTLPVGMTLEAAQHRLRVSFVAWNLMETPTDRQRA